MYYYSNSNDGVYIFLLFIIIFCIGMVISFILFIVTTFKNGLRFEDVVRNKDKEIQNLKNNMANVKVETENIIKNIETEKNKLNEKLKFIKINFEAKECLLKYELNPRMVKIYNDFYEKHLKSYEEYFRFKKNPSYKSADYIKEIKSEYKRLQVKNKQLELLLSKFLEEKNENITETEKIENTFDDGERAYRYNKITKEEWAKLSYIEKLDLTVSRYKEKWKDKLNIGLEFERYCGYLYEKNDYKVDYNGILKGKSDGGIDLIASNKNKKIYIQCKYWSINKQIRENAITQLFGSALKKAIDDGETYNSFIEKLNSEKIRIVLLTKTELSLEAKLFCKKLNILYKEKIEINPNYPIVKGVSGEERIFYIPTDLQYDNIKYKSTSKEYCRFKTCKEAEQAGYRHCYKWRGE